jgi:nitrite reductase/ring-hydroxylating ferredoxin subunit
MWYGSGCEARRTIESCASTRSRCQRTVSYVPKRFLCTSDQVAPTSVVRVDLPDGLSVAVYNLDGSYYATDNLCTHGDASLAEGVVEGDNIMCPFHGGTFDIRTGEPTAPPCVMPLRTYPVTVEDGQLFAEVE